MRYIRHQLSNKKAILSYIHHFYPVECFNLVKCKLTGSGFRRIKNVAPSDVNDNALKFMIIAANEIYGNFYSFRQKLESHCKDIGSHSKVFSS